MKNLIDHGLLVGMITVICFIPFQNVALAHRDPSTTPQIDVQLRLDSLNVRDSFLLTEVDGWEFLLSVEISQAGHLEGLTRGVIFLDNQHNRKINISQWMYAHYECSPRSPLTARYELTEVDNENSFQLIAGAIGSVGGIYSAFYIAAASPVLGAVGAVAGASLFLMSLDGDDEEGIIISEGSGQSNTHYDVVDHIRELSVARPTFSPPCGDSPTTCTRVANSIEQVPTRQRGNRSEIPKGYRELNSAWSGAASIVAESGIPDPPSPAEVESNRQTFRDAIVTTVDSLALVLVESLVDSGAVYPLAQVELAEARALWAAGNRAGATEAYARTACLAWDEFVGGVEPAGLWCLDEELPQDCFPADGTLNPGAPGRIDAARLHKFEGGNPAGEAGDTLSVHGGWEDSEVYVEFAVAPGPFVNQPLLTLWLSTHQFNGVRNGLSWYSARMDTAEVGGSVQPYVWMATYHESDPNFIGSDTTLDPFDPSDSGSHLANDIFPDDLLTPGSRLCFFYKAQPTSTPGSWSVYPDTTGGRYVEMEVLPSSMAADSTWNCLLYVNHTGSTSDASAFESALVSALPGVSENFEHRRWDRWDVRAAALQQTGFARPPGEVRGASFQQLSAYSEILWHSGSDAVNPMAELDADLLITWLAYSASLGSRELYLAGDGLASWLDSAPPESRSRELLNSYCGAQFRCENIQCTECPVAGSPEETADCLALVPAAAGHVSLPYRSLVQYASGNGPPQLKSFDVLEVNPAVATARGDEYYVGPTKGPITYSSVTNHVVVDGDWKTVLDGFSPVARRGEVACGAGDLAAARIAEIVEWFDNGQSLCEANANLGSADLAPPPRGLQRLHVGFHPNPLLRRGRGHFLISHAQAANVEIKIFDLSGRLIRQLDVSPTTGSSASVSWDGSDERGRSVPSGVYLVRVTSGQESATTRLVVYQ